jgi:hypothetical protein
MKAKDIKKLPKIIKINKVKILKYEHFSILILFKININIITANIFIVKNLINIFFKIHFDYKIKY